MKLLSRSALFLLSISFVLFAMFALLQISQMSAVPGSITRSPSASQPLIAAAQATTPTIAATQATTPTIAATQATTPTIAATQATTPTIAATKATTPTITAVGRVELIESRPVVLQVGGIVEQVAVKVGDEVASGDLLLSLQLDDLQIAVRRAEIGLEQAEIALKTVSETLDSSTLAVAEADLLAAQEQLVLTEAGPTEEELEAAKSTAAAAWASYDTLKAGPTQAELDQSSASVKLAELDVQEAQRAFDEIKWRGDADITPESAALQRATISHQATQSGYAVLVKGATTAQLQGALASAQSAQNSLNLLQKRPTPAELASAKAAVAAAAAAVTKLKTSGKAGELRSAELSVEQAKMGLAAAQRDLANARLSAPIAGVVIAVNAQVGQSASAGTAMFEIADIANLQVTVNVEQRDLPKIKIGQKVEVSVYGFADKVFAGTVERIAPVGGQATSGPITFAVVIEFGDSSLEGLLPGMAATANFQ